MSYKELSYEQQLETMNEDGLREECLRLKQELDKAMKDILSKPILKAGIHYVPLLRPVPPRPGRRR